MGLSILAFLLPISSPVAANNLTLYSAADTTVAAQDPNGNYGTGTSITIQAFNRGDIQRGLFQFDISSIPAGSTINRDRKSVV
jgi:hypothetical protein